jgi:hypothetical protein
MASEVERPKLEIVPEQLDADEAEFNALRRDQPSVKGAAAALAIKQQTEEPSVGETTAQPTPSEDRMKKAEEAFARFQAIQIDPKAAVAARQIITSCPVRRPRNNEFVRVNVDAPTWTGLIHEDKEEDAFYMVTPRRCSTFTHSRLPKCWC